MRGSLDGEAFPIVALPHLASAAIQSLMLRVLVAQAPLALARQ